MSGNRVKVGIVGLGRWAKVLTRAAAKSDKLEIVAGLQPLGGEARGVPAARSASPRAPDLTTLLADPEIKGVILTVPNEQHLPVAARGREGRQARLHREADRQHAGGRPRDRGAGEDLRRHRHRRPQRAADGRHPRHRQGDRRRRARPRRASSRRISPTSARSSSRRKTWRWYKDRAPGGPLSQLAIHQFDVLHYLGGEIVEASSMASKLSPVGAEVDDQSMTLLRFADGKIGYVGIVAGPRPACSACACSARRA